MFPAAILQPPFFDPDADPAVNYGAIGGVIGHEITHGFDDQGRKSDGDGVLRDWWAPEDAAKFEAQTARLGAQYEAFDVKEGDVNYVKPEDRVRIWQCRIPRRMAWTAPRKRRFSFSRNARPGAVCHPELE